MGGGGGGEVDKGGGLRGCSSYSCCCRSRGFGEPWRWVFGIGRYGSGSGSGSLTASGVVLAGGNIIIAIFFPFFLLNQINVG